MKKNELIEQNLRLVHACAHRFTGKGVEYDDLYSAGCVGLVKAVNRFDPSLGFRLSTYAVPVILGEIRQLFRDGGSVKLSRSLRELSLKANDICARYKAENGADIGVTALAEQLGTDIYTASQALNASQTVLSLSGDGDDGGLDIPIPSPEEALTDRLSLRQAVEALDSDEQILIRLRYYQHKTQTQTAEALGTTQVQISRREKKILLKLRAQLI
nr:sigma-70 family RNA polymerase sigma factor [uncultured Ruminococcus sp.]